MTGGVNPEGLERSDAELWLQVDEALGLCQPLPPSCPPEQRPVVLVGPWEHHSNMLPWRESCAQVVTIRDVACSKPGARAGVDMEQLEEMLRTYQGRPLVVGAFSAASNITGVTCNTDAISALLHRYGALACWDCATAAPHMRVNMNPVAVGADRHLVYKDAIFMSGHKFVGGPGTPGVLVVKRRLLANAVPTVPGGGSVFFVTPTDHRFLRNREEREEAGSPDLLGIARLGLAVRLQQQVCAANAEGVEDALAKRMLDSLQADPAVVVLGAHLRANPKNEPDSGAPSKRLPIVSFLIRYQPRGAQNAQVRPLFLHYNFVCALLNDLFGIQSRGGCMCAGPYAQRLLGLGADTVRAVETQLLLKHELLRPGFTRLSLTFFNSPAEVNYILHAVHFIARRGHLFLSQYRMNHVTGEWKHVSRASKFPERRWLGSFDLMRSSTAAPGGVCGPESHVLQSADPDEDGELECLQTVQANAEAQADLLESLGNDRHKAANAAQPGSVVGAGLATKDGVLPPEGELLRWFAYPWELLNARADGTDGGALVADGAAVNTAIIDPSLYGVTLAQLHTEREWQGSAAPFQAHKHQSCTVNGTAQPGSAPTPGELVDNSAASCVRQAGPAAPNAHPATAPGAPSAVSTVALMQGGSAESVAAGNGAASTHARPSPPQLSHKYYNKYPRREGGGAAAMATASNGGGNVPTYLQLPGAGACSLKPVDLAASMAKVDAALAAPLFPRPPAKLLRTVSQAILEWEMIEDGDRLCLGLSGGKDSLALMHVLLDLKQRAPVRFELVCATVDPQTPSFDPSPLKPYCAALGVTLHYLSDGIVERAKSKLKGDSLCSFCSRAKRGLLYTCCRENGYNKLVLAQHLDDLAESFMMSMLHNGQARTMKASYLNDAGDIAIIRPLAYTREVATRDFSTSACLPVINENCPACFEQPKERARVKEMLAREESLYPGMFHNIRQALVPLMHPSMYPPMRDIRTHLAARSTRTARRSLGTGSSKWDQHKQQADGTSGAEAVAATATASAVPPPAADTA